jgi:hypothetical protein
MLQESSLCFSSVASPLVGLQEHLLLPLGELDATAACPQQQPMDSGCSVQDLMQGLIKPAVPAILATPIKKTGAAKPPEAVCRSG